MDVAIGQRLVLSPILSALFITPIFHIFEKRIINNTNANLFCSYNTMSSLLEQFRLMVEHRKTKIFHFSRLHGIFDPLSLCYNMLGH